MTFQNLPKFHRFKKFPNLTKFDIISFSKNRSFDFYSDDKKNSKSNIQKNINGIRPKSMRNIDLLLIFGLNALQDRYA